MGTTLALAGEANLLDEHGNMPGITDLRVESTAATLVRCSGSGIHRAVESAAGVKREVERA